MDMNLGSPYLLAPHLHPSKESLHNMAKSFNSEQDPYHTVPLYSGNGDGLSLHSKDGVSRQNSPALNMRPPPRTNSMPKSPASPAAVSQKSDPFATPKMPEPTHQTQDADISELHLPVQPIIPEIGSVYPDEKAGHHNPPATEVRAPPPVLPKDDHYELPSSPGEHGRFELPDFGNQDLDKSIYVDNNNHHASLLPEELPAHDAGLNFQLPQELPPQDHQTAPPPIHVENMDNEPFVEYNSYPQHQPNEYYEDVHSPYAYEDEMHGYAYSQDGLGVPGVDTRRHSIGFRPLPPDEVNESEDPEYRANRIRSFYKEYFEEGHGGYQGHGQEYYDGYDGEYANDGAYYDPHSNAFVMPYAQPVMRRAMTPPPGGRRGGPPMMGPRGPGRRGGPGSVGGMSAPGGRGRPRAGSAFAGRGTPKKRLPPPQALNTLPTPSLLKDDSAIFNATDFAPPDSYREAVAGRSQSPMGEQRPYKPIHAASSPLANAFDDLAALPSPHMLRKSNTFTGLDFAPPKKFKDPSDQASDAGSIRSNRSGISARQLGAIRAGAGRVSRLPGDTVFTAASSKDQLRPQWGLRT